LAIQNKFIENTLDREKYIRDDGEQKKEGTLFLFHGELVLPLGRGECAPRVPLACVTCPYAKVTGNRYVTGKRRGLKPQVGTLSLSLSLFRFLLPLFSVRE